MKKKKNTETTTTATSYNANYTNTERNARNIAIANVSGNVAICYTPETGLCVLKNDCHFMDAIGLVVL